MSHAWLHRFAYAFSLALPAASPTDWEGETHPLADITLGDTNYRIEDSASALLAADSAILEAAESVAVAGNYAETLTVAEFQQLYQRTSPGSYWGYSIQDSASALLGSDIEILIAADDVSLTDNDAGSLSVSEWSALRDLTSSLDWNYAIVDTVVNLLGVAGSEMIASARSISLAAGAVTAESLNILDGLIERDLDARAVTQVSGSAGAVAQALSADGMAMATDVAVTISAGSASAEDLGRILANTSAVVDATALTNVSGMAHQIAFALNSSGLTFAADLHVLVTGLAAAADLIGMDGKTTYPIDASQVFRIEGSVTDLADALSATGIDVAPDVEVTVHSAVADAALLASMDAKSSAKVDASAVITITGTAAQIAAVMAADGVGLARNVATRLDAGAASAIDLLSIDRHATTPVDASQINAINGSAAELLRVIDAPGIVRAENFDATLTGMINSAEIARIEAANGRGSVAAITPVLETAYRVATPGTVSYVIDSGTFANLIDCAGAQTFHVAAGGMLNLIGSDGHNQIVFDANLPGDVTVSHAGTTAIFRSIIEDRQFAWIATDWVYAPAQTVVFSDGSQVELTLVGNSLFFGNMTISEIGEL